VAYALAGAARDRAGAGEVDRAVPPARGERFPATPAWRNACSLAHQALPACPELDCIRHLLPPGLIAAAELHASEVGVGADRALIAADIISEEAYLAALTGSLGIPFEPLDDLPRAACPLNDERLIEAAAVGILPMTVAGNLEYVVAPRALAARSMHLRRLTNGWPARKRA